MAHENVATSRDPVARKANPAKEKPVRMQVIFPADLVKLVDAYARQMTAENPFARPATRTDALKALVVDALKVKGLVK